MSEEVQTIGQRLKLLRSLSGKTQEQISEELSIPLNTYARYESDLRVPNQENALKLSFYFHISIAELLYGTGFAEHFPIVKSLPTYTKFTLRVEAVVLDKFRYICDQEHLTPNEELRSLLRKRIAEYEAKHGEIKLPEEGADK